MHMATREIDNDHAIPGASFTNKIYLRLWYGQIIIPVVLCDIVVRLTIIEVGTWMNNCIK